MKLKRIHGHMMSIGGSFWDLGAGAGKLVIAAAMMHNFEVSTSRRWRPRCSISPVLQRPAHTAKSSVLPLVLLSHLVR